MNAVSPVFLLQQLLERSARLSPAACALMHVGGEIGYGALHARACSLASDFRAKGLQDGARVVAVIENGPAFVETMFATWLAGGVFVPVSAASRRDKLLQIIDDCQPGIIVASAVPAAALDAPTRERKGLLARYLVGPAAPSWRSLADASDGGDAAPRLARIDEDLACIIYTTGSTGVQKGVMLSHRSMLSALRSIQTYLGYVATDRIICALPLTFDYGLYQVLLAFDAGASVRLEASAAFPLALIQEVDRSEITVIPGVPHLLSQMARAVIGGSASGASVRMVTTTGSVLPAAVVGQVRKAFPGARLFAMYGLTECKRVSYLDPSDLDSHPGSVGRGMSNQEIWLEDADGRRLPPGSQGELVVRGTHVMDGYWQRPAETAAVLRRQDDGRRVLRTGDEFLMDADGYLYFLGRRDDLVKVGGRRISTGTVERAIRSMAEVDEVAVIACEDDFGDDSLTAFVCTRPGHELVAQQVMRSCRRVLESAAVPRRVLFVATLPRNPHGKIDVPALRALASVAQSSVG